MPSDKQPAPPTIALEAFPMRHVPAVAVPVLAAAAPRREIGRALASLPAFFVLRTVNAVFFLGAVWGEWVRGRSLRVYEKGH